MADYFQLLLSSIDRVEGLALRENGDKLKLNAAQCQYLARELLETRRFLEDGERSLRSVYKRKRKAFLELYSVVKGAESLVDQCCCQKSSWLEVAVTLSEIKSDIVDIILHLKWWTSILDVIVRGLRSEDEEVLLQDVETEFGELLQTLYAGDVELEKAAQTDKESLLDKVGKTLANSKDQLQHESMLSIFLQSRLTSEQVHIEESLLSKLNHYKLNLGKPGHSDSGIIGRGSSGTVLDVTWFGRRCALKLQNSLDAKEAASLKGHQHPHVVRFYRYWEAPPRPGQPPTSHILMEHLPTDLLNHIKLKLEKQPPLSSMPYPLHVAIDIMLQIAKAMWHLYQNKLVHRDLKTGNVLLRPVGEDIHELFEEGYVHVKLGDFGSAKGYTMSSTTTPISNRFGTTPFSAPEVLAWKDGEQGRSFPPKADIWSFGMTCSEILSGQTPFMNESKGTLLSTLKSGVRPPLPNETPEYLKFCITSCWEKNPEDRPTFLDLWRMLRHAKLLSLSIVQPESTYAQFAYKVGKRGRSRQMPRPLPGQNLHPGDWRRIFQGIVRKVVQILGFGTTTPKEVNLLQSDRNLGPEMENNKSRRFKLKKCKSEPVDVMSKMAKMRDSNSVLGAEIPKTLKIIRTQRPNLCHIVNQVWPPENFPFPKDRNLDIIFFEGNVERNCADTWIQRGKPGVCWPRDWLPHDVGKSIRVFLLNYRIADGFGHVVENLQKHLVCSDLAGGGGWHRPIVLVGHSLGGIVMKHLVVELDRKVQSLPTLSDRKEIDRAKLSKSFLECLRGCFSYSVPHGGMVTTDLRMVTNVFGEFISEESSRKKFFQNLSMGSKSLEKLSAEFAEADRYGSDADNVGQIKLSALLEGKNFTGELLIREESMQTFEGEFKILSDSDHTEITKPIRQDHPIYKQLLDFLLLMQSSQIAGVAPTADVQ